MAEEIQSDEYLMASLQQEFSPSLFAKITERYEKKVFIRCREFVKDEDNAKDLVQEIFIKLYINLAKFHPENRFAPWFNTIVHHTCIDFLRKNKSKLNEQLTETLSDSVEELSELDKEVSDDLGIEILEQLLEQIPPEDKLLLLLKYNEDLSIKEIQKTTGLSESAVKMRIKRAKEKVTKLHRKSL
ncbi:RNA polymerase sigma factor [Flammeovirgaceae bacterium SG7u.111]|nr:RNA polymerase sigma factor [Flammeovirgaceae bacterium SG7u.132]WPO37172.1 RNA polymerase sigma factor [Flammeovirgaceae bacterium SG7u.111]